MDKEDVFRRFEWQDKTGLTWSIVFYNDPVGFSGFAYHSHRHGSGTVHVQTHNIREQKQSMACLTDVRVDNHFENRGLGSVMIREAIQECIHRGHKGIYGYLSDVDSDHFPKLAYWYRKLGFSVGFFDPSDPNYRFHRAGRIEMIFNVGIEESQADKGGEDRQCA